MFNFGFRYFLPYQANWKNDKSPLRLSVKARQVGLTHVDSYDSVLKAATKGGADVWIMSRDEIQSQQYFLNCKRWARILGHAANLKDPDKIAAKLAEAEANHRRDFFDGAALDPLTGRVIAIGLLDLAGASECGLGEGTPLGEGRRKGRR